MKLVSSTAAIRGLFATRAGTLAAAEFGGFRRLIGFQKFFLITSIEKTLRVVYEPVFLFKSTGNERERAPLET
ncbi:MAG: hypothetical protein EOP06_26530 [Proteobacteria bacterium]|nr:MAG: hypothetical protein EOP06_26530 [Pseudomonadota bacterium]